MLEDVLAREAPMAPAEVKHLVKSLEVKRSRDRVLLGKLSHTALLSTVSHGFQELPMVSGPILTKILEDISERRLWHRDLQQIVAHRDLLMSVWDT